LRLTYRKPMTFLDDLPLRGTLDLTAASRWRLAREHALRLRPPAFLEVPESRRAVLRERFGMSQLLTPEVHGYVLTDVSVVGENYVVFKDGTFIDSTLIMDAEHPIRQNPFVSDIVPIQDNFYESKWLDNDGPQIEEPTVFLGTAGVDLYHHWLFDAVLKLAVVDPDAFPNLRYAVPDNVPAPMIDWLGAFGIEKRRVVRTKVDVRTHFDRMILVPRPATSDVMLPQVLERLREVEATRGTRCPISCDRIFIGRSDAPTSFRQLLNEREITDELASLGYLAITPGAWPPLEQARIFAQADRIVALHGSGGANVVFSSKEARVMHLQPVDADYFTQHGLTSALRGQVFGYVFGETFSRDSRYHNVEWIIDWEVVRKAMREHDF
jgi:capsular polysaccharide biosynthesis protein